jgi:hypothetical protein
MELVPTIGFRFLAPWITRIQALCWVRVARTDVSVASVVAFSAPRVRVLPPHLFTVNIRSNIGHLMILTKYFSNRLSQAVRSSRFHRQLWRCEHCQHRILFTVHPTTLYVCFGLNVNYLRTSSCIGDGYLASNTSIQNERIYLIYVLKSNKAIMGQVRLDDYVPLIIYIERSD